MKKIWIMGLILCAGLFWSCNQGSKKEEEAFRKFVDRHVRTIRPMMKEAGETYFQATISGKEEDFNRYAALNLALSKVYTQKADFDSLKAWKEGGKIKDPLLARQLEVLFTAYQEKQLDTLLLEKIITKESQVENAYSNFRAKIGSKSLTDNEVEEILSKSESGEEVKSTWLACKEIGPIVAKDVLELVNMRNEAARALGFENFHQMSLSFGEQDPKAIEKLFDELDLLTRDSFLELKQQIDTYLCGKFKIQAAELRPWHYQNRFFQEAPKLYSVDLDKYYAKADIASLTKKYFEGIGLPIDMMLEKSDLYEKPGKNQHAYCIDIDNEGDDRVLCNIKPNYNWMNTNLHEFGHAVYDFYMPEELPFILREPAHTFTTEAIAMLFGRLASNPQWMEEMLGISSAEKAAISEEARKSLRLEQLVFSRWSQVMYRFEKAMYENPDQDLNTLWWDLVEKYQGMKRPEGRNMPDWATKIHIATVPCYYHNYLMGELLASQLNSFICRNIIKSESIHNQSFTGRKEVGDYLKANVFSVGMRYRWEEMIEKATGEPLNPKYYSEQFVN